MALFFRKFLGILVVAITCVGVGLGLRQWSLFHTDLAMAVWYVFGFTSALFIGLVYEIK